MGSVRGIECVHCGKTPSTERRLRFTVDDWDRELDLHLCQNCYAALRSESGIESVDP